MTDDWQRVAEQAQDARRDLERKLFEVRDALARVEAVLDDADVMYLHGMGVMAVEESKVRAALAGTSAGGAA